tara:strand:- start:202 stop:495 length:294 start_codon:yes stop_codon:yes gene_type:complete
LLSKQGSAAQQFIRPVRQEVFDMDDSWREEYKQLRNLKENQIKVLDEGAKSLAQSWMLNAMHQDYKRIKNITDPEPPDCSSSFQEWNQGVEEQEEKQ